MSAVLDATRDVQTDEPQARQALTMSGVTWADYSRLLRIFEDRPGYRLTFDRGALEIMSPSFRHDRRGHLLNRFVCVMTEEMDVPIVGGRTTTLRRRQAQRGLEPDDCYWIAHAADVGEKDAIDLNVDPPPDLAAEIDETHSSLDRMGIYQSLRIPEIWRSDRKALVFLGLTDEGDYEPIDYSRSFPWLTAADLSRFLDEGLRTKNETALIARFRKWVRKQLAQT